MRSDLDSSAPLARALAPALCSHECGAYHGAIQDLRLLDLVVTPEIHGDFFRQQIGSLAQAGARDVLVSGCADYGMLNAVVAAFEGVGAPAPAVTVLDRCPTPLMLCRWWAASRPLAIATLLADATTLDLEARWDVITTESLLTLLTPPEREQLAVSWHRGLRPGGAVVTSCRLQPGNGPEVPSEERADAFEHRVRAEIDAGSVLPSGLTVDELAAAARRFALSVQVWPITSADELVAMLEGAGLAIETLDLWEDEGLMSTRQAAAGARRPATYARVVSKRA